MPSSDNVVVLDGVTRLDIPVERVIESAGEANLDTVVVVGVDSDGEFYFASNTSDGGQVLWCLEKAKLKLLTLNDG